MRSATFRNIALGILALAGAYHLGARWARAQTGGAPDVAMLSGVVADGGTIPLPHYQDGTEALESECQWTVSPQVLSLSESNWTPRFQRCRIQGRQVRVYWCRTACVGDADCIAPPPGCPGPIPGVANYLIVAVRNLGPTPVQHETFGGVKARYR